MSLCVLKYCLNQELMGKTEPFSYFWHNLHGALTQSSVSAVGEANERNCIPDYRSVGPLRFSAPVRAAREPRRPSTQMKHNRTVMVKPLVPLWPDLCLLSDTGADSAHGQLHEPLEPRPPSRLTQAAGPVGRGRQALPRNELLHQGPHATVIDRLRPGRGGVCIRVERVGLRCMSGFLHFYR